MLAFISASAAPYCLALSLSTIATGVPAAPQPRPGEQREAREALSDHCRHVRQLREPLRAPDRDGASLPSLMSEMSVAVGPMLRVNGAGEHVRDRLHPQR